MQKYLISNYSNPKERMNFLDLIQQNIEKMGDKLLDLPAEKTFKPDIYTINIEGFPVFIKRLNTKAKDHIYRLLNYQLLNENASSLPFTYSILSNTKGETLVQEYFQATFYDLVSNFMVDANMTNIIFNFVKMIIITLIVFRKMNLLHLDLHGGNFMINQTESSGTNVYKISPNFQVQIPMENMEIVVIDYELAEIYPKWSAEYIRNILKYYFPIFYLTHRKDIEVKHENMYYLDMWLAMKTFHIILYQQMNDHTRELYDYISEVLEKVEKKIYATAGKSQADSEEDYIAFCRDVIEMISLIQCQSKIVNLFYIKPAKEQKNFDIISVESIHSRI